MCGDPRFAPRCARGTVRVTDQPAITSPAGPTGKPPPEDRRNLPTHRLPRAATPPYRGIPDTGNSGQGGIPPLPSWAPCAFWLSDPHSLAPPCRRPHAAAASEGSGAVRKKGVVPPARFERTAFPLGGGRSIQLSYGGSGRILPQRRRVSHPPPRRQRTAPPLASPDGLEDMAWACHTGRAPQGSLPMRVAVYSSKSYDRDYLDRANSDGRHELVYLESRLDHDSARAARGSCGRC